MSSEMPQNSHKKQKSRVHDVEDLRNRGIRKVRVVGESQLQEMAREAAAKAVLELAANLDLSDEARKSLVAKARESILDGSPGPSPQVIENPVVKPDVRVVDSPTQPSPPVSQIGIQDQEVLQELSKLIARDWRTELATVQDSHRAQVERLEMRIEELTKALRVTDQVLTRDRTQESTGGSIENPFDHKKEELLDQLFQANVALREISSGDIGGQQSEGEGRQS
ncbi:MAG: hypothetical protein ACPG1Z_11275 [Planctomycetota bacterium]